MYIMDSNHPSAFNYVLVNNKNQTHPPSLPLTFTAASKRTNCISSGRSSGYSSEVGHEHAHTHKHTHTETTCTHNRDTRNTAAHNRSMAPNNSSSLSCDLFPRFRNSTGHFSSQLSPFGSSSATNTASSIPDSDSISGVR